MNNFDLSHVKKQVKSFSKETETEIKHSLNPSPAPPFATMCSPPTISAAAFGLKDNYQIIHEVFQGDAKATEKKSKHTRKHTHTLTRVRTQVKIKPILF